MAIKVYKVGALTFQFEEGEQPAGAIEVKEKAEKAEKPENKAKTAKNK